MASRLKLSSHDTNRSNRRRQSVSNGADQPRQQAQAPANPLAKLASVSRPPSEPFSFHVNSTSSERVPGFSHASPRQQAQGLPSSNPDAGLTSATMNNFTFQNSRYNTTRSRPSSQSSSYQAGSRSHVYPDASSHHSTQADQQAGGAHQHVFLPEVCTSRPHSRSNPRPTTDSGKTQPRQSTATPTRPAPSRTKTAPEAITQSFSLKAEASKSPAPNDPLVAHMRKHLKDTEDYHKSAKEYQSATEANVTQLIHSYEHMMESFEWMLRDQTNLNGMCQTILESREAFARELQELRDQFPDMRREAMDEIKCTLEHALQVFDESRLRPQFDSINAAIHRIEETAERDRRTNKTRHNDLRLSLQSLETSVREQVDRVSPACEELANVVRENQQQEHDKYREYLEELQCLIIESQAKNASGIEQRPRRFSRATSPLENQPLLGPPRSGATIEVHNVSRLVSARKPDVGLPDLISGRRTDATTLSALPGVQLEGGVRVVKAKAVPQNRQTPKSRHKFPVETHPYQASIDSRSPSSLSDPSATDTFVREKGRQPAKRAPKKYGGASKKRRGPAAADEVDEASPSTTGRKSGGQSTARKSSTIQTGQQAGNGSKQATSHDINAASSPVPALAAPRGTKRRASESASKRGPIEVENPECVDRLSATRTLGGSATTGHHYLTRANGSAPTVPGVWW